MVPMDQQQNTTNINSNQNNRSSFTKLTAANTRHHKKNVSIDERSDRASEAKETTRFEIHERKNEEHNHKKGRQGSNSTVSPSIRKKITKRMTQAFSSRSNSGIARADISGFQTTEQEKTLVRKNLRKHATILFFLAVTATGLVLLDTQVKILWKQQNNLLSTFGKNETGVNNLLQGEQEKLELYKNVGIVLKSLLSVVSVVTCSSLLCYYKSLFRLKKVRNFYPQKMSFLRATPLLKKYFIECVICIFHVPPVLDLYVDIPNEVQVAVILRLYLLGRYLKEKHELMNSQSTRFLASVTKTELTSMFLFKTFFMQYPFQLILLAYFILLFIGGYGVWMIENRYSYLDTVWMLIITMTTVGFGDLTPKTMLGRFCVGITAIVGIFLMALFISLVNEALMLQRREKRILAYVENQDLTRHRKITALNAIGMWYKYHSHMKRHSISIGESVSFLGGRSSYKGRTTRRDLMNKMKAKLLETEMFQSINEWRRVKNARGGNYFAQEFMIEDMKNMVGDLNGKVNEVDEKLENLVSDLQLLSNNNVPRNMEENKMKENKCNCLHENTNKSNHGNINFNLPPKYNDNSNLLQSQINNHGNSGVPDLENTTFHMERYDKFVKNSQKNISELLRVARDGSSSPIVSKSELVIAFKLLKNQAQIMNNGLDDIYYKTRQDISDLDNLINSLLICADSQQNDTMDYVPSRELPV